MFDDGVCLPAADLHDGPRTGEATIDFLDQLVGEPLVPIRIQILHDDPPGPSGVPAPSPSNCAMISPISSKSL
jgi:hypothetical protein